MMRPLILMVALVTALAFAGIMVVPGIVAQVKGPADFQYEKGKGSPGTVAFSHDTHAKKEQKCTDCHNKIFKMKKGSDKLAMASMNEGKLCGTCHNGKATFATNKPADCAKCHKAG